VTGAAADGWMEADRKPALSMNPAEGRCGFSFWWHWFGHAWSGITRQRPRRARARRCGTGRLALYQGDRSGGTLRIGTIRAPGAGAQASGRVVFGSVRLGGWFRRPCAALRGDKPVTPRDARWEEWEAGD